MIAAVRLLGAAALGMFMLPNGTAAADTDNAEACAARLVRTLAEMEARPLLKEELATGLMWIRLDAQTALEAGDAETCLQQVRLVEKILGLEPPGA